MNEHQDDRTNDGLVRLGDSIGLDRATLPSDRESGRYDDRVCENFMSGTRGGVNGTPTFFINGFRHGGSWDFGNLVAVLETVARGGQ